MLLGFLFAVYCLSGTDAAAHIAEETRTADWGAPRSLILSYCANATYGLAFVLAILFSMQARSSSCLCQAVWLRSTRPAVLLSTNTLVSMQQSLIPMQNSLNARQKRVDSIQTASSIARSLNLCNLAGHV